MTKAGKVNSKIEKALSALEESTAALASMADPHSVLRTIAGQVRKVTEIGECSIVLFEGEDTATIVASSEDPELRDKVINLEKYPELIRVIETKQALVIEDVASSTLLGEVSELLNSKNIRSIAVLPVSADHQLLGAMFLRLQQKGDPLGEVPLHYFQATANAAALALRNITLRKDVSDYEQQTLDAQQIARKEHRYRRRYQELFDLASDGLIIIDSKGRVVNVNDKFTALTGYPKTEAMQMTYLDLVSEKDHAKAEQFFREYRTTPGPARESFKIATRLGDVRDVLVRIDLLSGEEANALVSLQDITEEKKLQEQLQRTKDFFENLIQSSVDAILAADMKGKIMVFNEAAERISGYKAEEVIGKMNIVDVYSPGGAKDAMRKLRSSEYGGVGKLEATHYTIISKEGEEIPINVSAAVIYEEGKEIATVGIFQDIRPRIKIERELRAAQQKLVEAEKQAALAALSGAAAHELNQPLTSILGYAELLQNRLTGEDDATRKAVETIAAEAERMGEIIRKISRVNQYRTREYVGKTRILDLDSSSAAPGRYENLFLSMRDGLLEFKCDENLNPTECVFANPAAVGMLGKSSANELLEESFTALFGNEDSLEELKKEASKEGGGAPVTLWVRRSDDSSVAVEIAANLVQTGDAPAAMEMLCRDVTDRVKVQEELAESEQRARTLVDMAGEVGVGITIIGLEGENYGSIIFANERLERILGYKMEELEDFSIMKLIKPEDREEFQNLFNKALKGDESTHHLQGEVIRRDGGSVYIELHATVTSYLGQRALIGFLMNITDWVTTREELRELKEYNENIINAAPIGIITVDTDGTVLSINERFREIMGLISGTTVMGANILQLETVSGTQVEELIRSGLEGKRISVSRLPYVNVAGVRMTLRAEGVPLTDTYGNVTEVVVLLEDVSEEAELEESLRRERNYQESIVERSPSPVVAVSLSADLVLFNKAAEELSGYSRDEVLGKSVFEVFGRGGDEERKDFRQVLESLKTGANIENLSSKLNIKDGSTVEVLWNAVPVFDAEGNINGIVGIGRNVTEEKRLSEEAARRRKVLQAMHRIARASVEGSGFKGITRILREEMAGIIEHDVLTIGLVKNGSLEYWVLNPGQYPIPRHGSFPLEGTFSRKMIENGKPRLVKDFRQMESLHIDDEGAAGRGSRSAMNMPLMHGERVFGTINVGSHQPEAFSEEDFNLFKQIADEFSVALENTLLVEELKDRNEDLARKTGYMEALLRAGRMFRIDMKESEVAALYVNNVKELFPSTEIAVLLIDSYENKLLPASVTGKTREVIPEGGYPIQGKMKSWLNTKKDYIYYRDLKRVKRYDSFLPDARAALMIPLKMGENRLGLMIAENEQPNPFPSDDLDLLVLVARQMAVSINNLRLFDQACFLERTQENILQNASAMIIVMSPDGIITLWNDTVEHVLGFPKEEMVGRRAIEVWKEYDMEEKAMEVWNRIKDGKETTSFIVNLKTKDGRKVKTFFNSMAVHDLKGRILQYIFVGYDLTDRELLERQLAQSSKLATVGQMAAGIAHELNNPLTSISSYAELLYQNLKKRKEAQEESRHAKMILESADRLERLVNNLLDYSRADYEEMEPVPLNRVIDEALNIAEYDLTRGKVKINKQLEEPSPVLWGISGQIQQVVINLAANSSHALQNQGGGNIYIKSYKTGKNNAVLEISDDGPGMDSEKSERIFEPFYTTKPRGQGTGLGLSIVQDIVKKHKGSIRVKTTPGKGTTFRVTFPAYTFKKTSDGKKH